MADLTQQQISFLNKFLNTDIPVSVGEKTADDGSALAALAARITAVLQAKPQAERILNGLLREAETALKNGESAEYRRQTGMLTERLGTWEQIDELPDLRAVLDKGLLKKSRDLNPEESEVMAAAYEEAKFTVKDLPDAVREPAMQFVADLNGMKQRGEQLVQRIQKGDLGPIDRAAHHNEIDQICVQIESMAADLSKLLQKENML